MRYDDNDIQRIEGDHYEEGKAVGIHFEKGPEGGIVQIDDTTILEKAKQMLEN